MKRDYATTFATEVVVIASYLLTFRIVAVHLGTTGFGEYALSRRTLSLLMPLAVLGMDVAIARFVAYASAKGGAQDRSYIVSSLLVTGAALGIVSVCLFAFQGWFAQLFFGSSAYRALILALPLVLVGGDLHVIAYGYLRGRSQVQRANVLMALNQALVPLLAVLFAGASVPRILTAIGLGWIAISLVFLATLPLSTTDLRSTGLELLRFGSQRVPGDLFQLTLFALPGILVAHLADVKTAGIVAFGVAALGMIGSALTPISFVMLPVAARHFAGGAVGALRAQVIGMARVTVPILVLATLVGGLFASSIVTGYLGPSFESGTTVLRIMILGALPWGLYVTLKSVIDARHLNAINARNMGIAFVSFLIALGILQVFSPSAIGAVIAFVLALYVLGGLTLIEIALAIRTPLENGRSAAWDNGVTPFSDPSPSGGG